MKDEVYFMNHFSDAFRSEINAKTENAFTVTKKSVRISIITSNLIRIENQQDGIFCDMPTQAVLNRNFQKPSFSVSESNNKFTIKTENAIFVVSYQGKLIQVRLKNGDIITDFKKGNLKGTTRTLDMSRGAVKLNDGILSRNGVAVIDDSSTLILADDGTVVPRDEYLSKKSLGSDIYVFAYGHDYKQALRDFYSLTGSTPLIPRFALGNWWSRYKAYTQQEYLSLMKRFTDEEIPISVATIDMDWHWVDVEKRFGKDAKPKREVDGFINKLMALFQSSGWTGYSWNTELFPDYKKFLQTLKNDNYKVTVNLHPSDGVRFFENMYEEFAKFMGIDPTTKQPISFDISDKKFIEGYFKYLHHGYENDGVDFWWIDWQQGSKSPIKGLDPLWWLNHYHSIDSSRNGKRPLILSRYAGHGSHRYPLGFSGDTHILWKSLAFQPYFTATASNSGYTWWSHDIGGHCFGERNDELYIRWLQLGVFSPIMRLHSTNNEFLGKEPWKFGSDTQRNATSALRFRHRLIPYLYTMNMLTHRDGRPLIEPMYYENSEENEAYEVPNEYWFGTELIVAPITKKINKKTLTACSDVWLPNGRYTDIFTGRIYKGNQKIKMFRDLSSIPVLAKDGAIIPLAINDRTNNYSNPEEIEILIYRGNGLFTLYEDDGETMNYKNGAFAETLFEVKEDNNNILFTVESANGDISVIPQSRKYIFNFCDVTDCENLNIKVNDKTIPYEKTIINGKVKIILTISPTDKLCISMSNITVLKNPSKKELLIELFSKIQGNNLRKQALYTVCLNNENIYDKIIADSNIKNSIREINSMEFR